MTDVYTGALPCKCIVAVCVDEPDHKRDVATSVADYIRRGYSVEHRPLKEVQADPLFLANCGGEHHTRKRREQAAQMGAGL